jgi:hypothetical protein
MVPDIVDIDPDINYIPAHRRLLIVYVADQPLEVSINDGRPRVKKGASISSILCPLKLGKIRNMPGESVSPVSSINSTASRETVRRKQHVSLPQGNFLRMTRWRGFMRQRSSISCRSNSSQIRRQASFELPNVLGHMMKKPNR